MKWPVHCTKLYEVQFKHRLTVILTIKNIKPTSIEEIWINFVQVYKPFLLSVRFQKRSRTLRRCQVKATPYSRARMLPCLYAVHADCCFEAIEVWDILGCAFLIDIIICDIAKSLLDIFFPVMYNKTLHGYVQSTRKHMIIIRTQANIYYKRLIDWLRSCQYDNGHMDVRSHIKVHTDERTQVHSAQSSLVVTHPSTNRARRYLLNFSDQVTEQALVATADLTRRHTEKKAYNTIELRRYAI